MTGATGFIGSELLRRLLARNSTAEIFLALRPGVTGAASGESAEARFTRLLLELTGTQEHARAAANRVRCLECNLAEPGLGLSSALFEKLARRVTEIYHLAADVRFHLPPEEARRANVEPVRQLVRLAGRALEAGQFRHFHHVSTYAVTRGPIALELPAALDTAFRNTYESTKAEAERLLLDRAEKIPVTLYRTGIVAGDSRTGWTSRFNSFYQVMRLFLSEVAPKHGRFYLSRGSRLEIATVDSVCDVLLALAVRPGVQGESGRIFHLTCGAAAPSLSATLNRGLRHLMPGQSGPEFLERQAGISSILDQVAESCGGRQSLVRMFARYTPYFDDATIYDNRNTLAALAEAAAEGDIRVPPRLISLGEALEPVLDYCMRTDWGDRPEGRPPLSNPERIT